MQQWVLGSAWGRVCLGKPTRRMRLAQGKRIDTARHAMLRRGVPESSTGDRVVAYHGASSVCAWVAELNARHVCRSKTKSESGIKSPDHNRDRPIVSSRREKQTNLREDCGLRTGYPIRHRVSFWPVDAEVAYMQQSPTACAVHP